MTTLTKTAVAAAVGSPVKTLLNEQSLTWQYSTRTRESTKRFLQVLEAAIFSQPNKDAAEVISRGQLAARLVCLDGVRVDALPFLASSRSVPYRCGDHVAIEWLEGPANRVERRFLHPLTLSVWPRVPGPAKAHVELPRCQYNASSEDGEDATHTQVEASAFQEVQRRSFHLPIGDLRAALRQWLQTTGIYSDDGDVLEQLAWDQMAWWCEILPGPLFAHGIGEFPLCAVDRSTWVRLQTKQALVESATEIQPDLAGASPGGSGPTKSAPEPSSAPPMTSLDQSVTDELLGKLDFAGKSGFNEAELRAALHVLRLNHATGVDGWTKRLWIGELTRLQLGSPAVSHVTVTLVGWICHICEVGTISSTNPAVSTIRSYVSSVLMALGRAFKGEEKQPEDWSSEMLLRRYRSIYAGKSSGTKPAALAALQSFQEYLVQVFDTEQLGERIATTANSEVPPKRGELKENQPSISDETDKSPTYYVPRVVAHVVWQHEIDWCIQACEQVEDVRLGGIARVMLAISRECAVRYQDLSRLKIQNFHFFRDSRGEYCQIEVVREASSGRLKTEQSQRHLVVRNPESIAIMRAWLQMRKAECAPGRAYVFGEINADRDRYRPTGVQALLSKLLKRATGCKRIRFHDLRHSVISSRVSEILMSSAWVDANLLEIAASEAGHASPRTTLRSYSHLYEQSLRLHIDIALIRSLSASSEKLAQALGAINPVAAPPKGNTLVQMARRSRMDINAVWLGMLRIAVQRLPVEPVCASFQYEMPKPLPNRERLRSTVPPHLLVDALGRWADKSKPATISAVTGIPIEQVSELFSRLESWLFELYRRQFPRLAFRLQLSPSFKDMLHEMRIVPAKAADKCWADLSRYLQSQVTAQQMQRVIRYWEGAAPGTHLRLYPSAEPRGLIGLFKASGMAWGHLRVVIQEDRPVKPSEETSLPMEAPHRNDHHESPARSQPSRADALQFVTELFEQEFGASPMVEVTSWRSDRPMAYLKINPHERASKTGASADHTAALRAWMLAIKARLILDELQGSPRG